MFRHTLLSASFMTAAVIALHSSVDAAISKSRPLIRCADVSQREVVFVAADNLWLVPRSGGLARRLSDSRGRKGPPRFSPDGKQVGFTVPFQGGDHVFVLAVHGGEPKQLTYYPMQRQLHDWTANNEFLFSSNGLGPYFRKRLFTLPVKGGLPTQLPLEYGTNGSLSGDGQKLAFTIYDAPRSWKRYVGGGAPDVWILDNQTRKAEKITDWRGTDMSPMWNGDTLYYVSDGGPEHRLNLWSYDMQTKRRTQLTRHTDFDVQQAAIGPSESGEGQVVFQLAGDLHLLDCRTGNVNRLAVDFPEGWDCHLTKEIDIAEHVQEWDPSPNADEFVVEARGDLWMVSHEGELTLRLTESSAIAERKPAWSPDGEWIAYWSDKSGEYELYRRKADGSGSEEQLTQLGLGLRRQPSWSPDSKKVAFSELDGDVYCLSLSDKQLRKVGRDLSGSDVRMSWSSDSSWLAYTCATETHFTAIWIYDILGDKSYQMTSGRFNDSWPAFDLKGEWLYFVSDRDFSKSVYDRIDGSFVFPRTDTIVAMRLQSKNRRPEKAAAKEDGSQRTVQIDLKNPESRVVSVGGGPAFIWNLSVAADNKLVYTHVPLEGDTTIRITSWPKKVEPADVVRAADFRLRGDGQRILVHKERGFKFIDCSSNQQLGEATALRNITMQCNLREEWSQIFRDARRYVRDLFYDPSLHAINWDGVMAKYKEMQERCASRDDVNYVLEQMLGELNVSHAGVGNAGDVERPKDQAVGLLGVDFEFKDGHTRIRDILNGAPWDVDVRSPLLMASEAVHANDYLVAVNEKPLTAEEVDPYKWFCGLAEKDAVLTVARDPAGKQSVRQIRVHCMKSEETLRYRTWLEATRRRVDEESGGRLGYLFLPSTNNQGVIELQRQFYGQRKKPGLVIDVRWNGGGMGPNRFIEFFDRPFYFYDANDHTGGTPTFPEFAHFGPKCMIINGAAGSGGDNIAFLFKHHQLGKTTGTRTAGALLAGTGSPRFIDGGNLYLPVKAPYLPSGWVIESHGVEPDVFVPPNPVNDSDPQLEAAIGLLLKDLKEATPQRPSPPAYPDGRTFRSDPIER
ncbi:MAG: S41 family peptidase [Pirellulales bacterium]